MACILWMICYYNIPYLQSVLTQDGANSIEFFLLADALYFAIIMFTPYHSWSWVLCTFLFLATANNMLDEIWGDPHTFTMQERMFLFASVCASFYIGFLSRKKNNT